MDSNYVISDFATHMPMRCSMQRFGHERQQMHDYFEITLIVDGSCNLQMDEHLYRLQAGDLFCVNPHTLHELRGIDCVSITILFDQTVFEQILPVPAHFQFFCISSVSDETQTAALNQLRSYVARIVKNNVDKLSGYELRNWSYIYALMDITYNHFRIQASDASEKKNYKYAMRISEISQIIQKRYTENLTLNEVAEEVHLSVPYLSKFFTEYYGMNFLTCLNQYRLNHAVHELLNTDKNIDEIAADSGFSSSHAFVTTFKKDFHLLPNVYRREQKRRNDAPEFIMEQHDYIAGLKKYLQDAPGTQTLPAPQEKDLVLSLDAGSAYPLRHTWRNVTTVGTASDLLLADVQNMLEKLQTDIGFHYIKINGIFSDDLHVYNESPSGDMILNFTYIDKVLDFLASCHLMPWIQLSYMPEKLAKHPTRRLFNANVSQPRSNEAWCQLVSAFLAHIMHRYGMETVVQWRFSVWNQPDTDTNLYGFDRPDDFFLFYKATYECVKQVSSDLIFCLPPTFYVVDDHYDNWYLTFLEKCRQHQCLPDCLNFTYYETKLHANENNSKKSFGFVYTMSLSENLDGLKDFVMQVTRERKKLGLGQMPIYLTEWNNTPSQQDLLNDTCFKSCYIVKNILENYDRLESFAYWSLTDLMTDGPLPDKLFFGGLGLFTTCGIPKASYYAFVLLSRLGDQFLGRGDCYFVTRSGNTYQILLYNYKHFSYLYANGERFDMTDTDRYTVFADHAPLHIHLDLQGLSAGPYRITETYINREAGSVFDAWANAGGIEPTIPRDLERLRFAAYPGYKQQVVSASPDGSMSLHTKLELLEVRLLELEPIL